MKEKATLNQVEEKIYQKRKTVRYDIRDLTVETISSKYEDSIDDDTTELGKKKFNYIFIPEYQRDFTWESDRQSKLIESIILGLPIPFIFVAENRNSAWEIVDGSQRIRTIHSFVSNKLRLHSLQSISELNGYTFEELDETRQGKILNTALRIIVLSEETTDDVKRDMFERINRGSDLLKPMEKRKGIYRGPFNEFVYDYCEKAEKFKSLVLVDRWLSKRQEHEELLLRFIALSETDAYKKGINTGISSYLDSFFDKKNKEWETLSPDDLAEERSRLTNKIDKVVSYVEKNFPYGFRNKHNPQTKRSVFEAISVGVWLAINDGSVIEEMDIEHVKLMIKHTDFIKYTNVANQLHKQAKLKGRVDYIYNLVSKCLW